MHWLEDWEQQAIIDFYPLHPDDGYRRVTDLMMDTDIVAASPGSVYRVLSEAGALRRWEAKPSKKGKGFVPPQSAHAHWHIDVSYLLATLTGPVRRRLTGRSPGRDLLRIEPALSAVLGAFGLVERRGFHHRGEFVSCRSALGIGADIREQVTTPARLLAPVVEGRGANAFLCGHVSDRPLVGRRQLGQDRLLAFL